MKKRYFESKRKELKGTPYDSCTERDLHAGVLSGARFHDKKDKIAYTVPHTYEPDFVLDKEGRSYVVEVKGRFRDSSEARKYLFIREVLSPEQELVFVWDRPNVVYPFAKKRKDGTKMTHEEWATKNHFRHWNRDTFSIEAL